MNPISDPNPVFSHDAIKYTYQKPDTRMMNPPAVNIKPFSLKAPEKSKKTKSEIDKKKKDNEKKPPLRGYFDLL